VETAVCVDQRELDDQLECESESPVVEFHEENVPAGGENVTRT
jgi:hypothetical protein